MAEEFLRVNDMPSDQCYIRDLEGRVWILYERTKHKTRVAQLLSPFAPQTISSRMKVDVLLYTEPGEYACEGEP